MKPTHAQHTINEVAHAYNTIAEHFSDTRSGQWAVVQQLIDAYVAPGQHILDIGCGNGRVSDLCATRSIAYTGCDISEGLIAQAHERHPNTTFIVANMLSLPFPDATFDHLILVASFHHIPSRGKRLAAAHELKRVVKPSGTIMMTNWNLYQPRYASLHARALLQRAQHRADLDVGDVYVPWKAHNGEVRAKRYYHAFTPRELREIARETQLECIEQYYELHGKKVSWLTGQNLVTILKRP